MYVPISVAGTIFGMNVKEINDSGHSIFAFLVMCAVLLLVTFFSWALTITLNRYRRRRKALYNLPDVMIRPTRWVRALDILLRLPVPEDNI